MRTLALAVTVSAIISAGCRDQQPVQPAASAGPEFMISDGAHNGNTHFFFLPPLAPDPSALFHAGTFNSKLAPVVEVCILTGDPSSGSPVDCMTSGGGPVLVFGPAPMALDATGQLYARNWDTKSPTPLDPSKFYRILVRGARAGTTLGFLDVDPVDQGMKNARTGEVLQFQDGRTLPIQVRVEDGAFGSTNPDHVEQIVADVATTVITNTGFAGASFPDGWLPQAARDAGINQVVLIIERIPVGPGTNEPTCLQSGLLERDATGLPVWHRPGWRREHLRHQFSRQQHHSLRGGGERERDADGHDHGRQHGAKRPDWHCPGWRGQHLRRQQCQQQHYRLRGGGERERDADGHDRGRQHGAKRANGDRILARSAAESCQAPAFAGAFG